jgi:hypothetical protein
MSTQRMADWKLDDLMDLRDQPFTDDIETLQLHFETPRWEIWYSHGKDWGQDSQRKILDSIKQLHTCRDNPHLKTSPHTKSPSTKKTPSKPVLPSCQKPSHVSTSAHLSGRIKWVIHQNPQEAL